MNYAGLAHCGRSPNRLARPSTAPGMRVAQSGRTIVELMIAMVLGMIVIGSVLSTVIGSSSSTRTQNNLGKLSEDAQIALNLVAGHIRMAGFSPPRRNMAPSVPVTNYRGASVRGCDGPMASYTVAMAAIACGAVNLPNSFSLAYEADLSNTMTALVGGVPTPTDCLGQPLAPIASPFPGFGNFFVAENRFFIRNGANGNPELTCAGNGDNFAAPQALIENVEDMRIEFGTSETTPDDFGNPVSQQRTTEYRRADQLDAKWPAEAPLTRWARVTSVQVCLLLRSDDFVTDQATPYVDCTGALVTPADRRIRVAVSTTVNLRNNSGVFQ